MWGSLEMPTASSCLLNWTSSGWKNLLRKLVDKSMLNDFFNASSPLLSGLSLEISSFTSSKSAQAWRNFLQLLSSNGILRLATPFLVTISKKDRWGSSFRSLAFSVVDVIFSLNIRIRSRADEIPQIQLKFVYFAHFYIFYKFHECWNC